MGQATRTETRGLKPGQRHSGQFKTGHDPRRYNPRRVNGKTIPELARENSEEALETILQTMRSTNDDKLRIQCAEKVIERGYGKAASAVFVEHRHTKGAELAQLTDEQLEQEIARLKQDDVDDDVLDAEYVQVQQPPEDDDE